MPRLMDLLDEPTGSVVRPLTLVRSTGEQLDVALTIADQQVSDGELLRLVRSDDAPPPPEVADVTDVLGETLRDRSGLWSRFARELTGAVAIGVLGCALAAQLPAGPLALVVAVVVLSVTAAILGRLSMRWICVALTSAALGVAATAVWTSSSGLGLTQPLRLSAAILGFAALGWICLGLGYGQGLRSRPAWFGCLVGIPVSALPLVMVLLGWRAEAAAAITAALSVVVCGVLPRLALVASGLTGLDDQVVEGHPRRRDDVSLTVNDAYRLLSWVTFAIAIPIAVTAALLLASNDLWAVAVGLVVIIVSALRTRAFPLAVQQMALWSGGARRAHGRSARPAEARRGSGGCNLDRHCGAGGDHGFGSTCGPSARLPAAGWQCHRSARGDRSDSLVVRDVRHLQRSVEGVLDHDCGSCCIHDHLRPAGQCQRDHPRAHGQ